MRKTIVSGNMKEKIIKEKIRSDGMIRIPPEIRRKFNWNIGEEINMIINPSGIFLEEKKIEKKSRKITSLRGMIKISNKRIVKRIIYGPEFEPL
jgi:bifunctional DNA-binding transcriptional regulator/antitoxin component of YhaV-PrlF toxin-antitoxin module